MDGPILPGGTSGAMGEHWSTGPLLQPLGWYSDKGPDRGVEGVAAGTGGFQAWGPTAAAHLEALLRWKGQLHQGGREEG